MLSNVTISLLEGSVNDEVLGTSGILIKRNWILTHGALLRLKMTINNKQLLDFISNLEPGKLRLLSSAQAKNLQVRVNYPEFTDEKKCPNDGQEFNEQVKQVNGTIIAAWRCPLLVDTFEKIFISWEFGNSLRDIQRSLSSLFLIIYVGDDDDEVVYNTRENRLDQHIREILNHLIDNNIYKNNITRGALIKIESTPFGNIVFMNSISQGIVSNILGINDSVMLTDANTVPGCEGGPVYVVKKNGSQLLCGMVIAPLSWCRNEWVNYTLVACFLPCLRKLLEKQEIVAYRSEIDENLNFTSLIDDNVLLIRCGINWGSGTLLNRETGTILTCSHVINEAPEHQINVIFYNDMQSNELSIQNKPAQLIYRTPKGLPYDIAVLKVNPGEINTKLRSLKMGDSVAVRGEKVIGAGFPFLSSRLPTITHGNISSVSACMLQTSCCVQSGASGGPIIRPTTGELLGIIVCNVITSSTIYPRLNMAIPIVAIKDPINKFIETNEPKALESLVSHDPSVLRAWNFHLSAKI